MKLLDAKLYDKEGITRSSNPTNRSSRLRFKTMLCSHATGVVSIGRKMDIQEQFNLVANSYDENRKKFISCFDDYYISSTDFIARTLKYEPKLIYDLGSGTGLFTSFWYKHFPKSEYVLIDIAEEMLDVAKKGFQEYWIDEIKKSGISAIEYERWLERKKLDREISINQEIQWLKDAGFRNVECIYSKGKFVVNSIDKIN